MSAPVVSIIIPTWNQAKLTFDCISSIKALTKEDCQIVLIDNGSIDQTLVIASDKLLGPGDLAIRNQINRGFAKANNQGLRLSEGEYVLFLNNDTRVLRDTWLYELLSGLRDADIIGSSMGKVLPRSELHAFTWEGRGKPSDKWHYLEGWCLFAKNKTFRKLAGWSEEFYPTYYDDVDLSFRARAAGMRLGTVDVPIMHLISQATPNYETYMKEQPAVIVARNAHKLYEKWMVQRGGEVA